MAEGEGVEPPRLSLACFQDKFRRQSDGPSNVICLVLMKLPEYQL